MNNSFGNIFRLTTFGESHGKAIGGIIDGCPAGHKINLEHISNEMSTLFIDETSSKSETITK